MEMKTDLEVASRNYSSSSIDVSHVCTRHLVHSGFRMDTLSLVS